MSRTGGPGGLPVIPVKDMMPCLEHGCSLCCHDIEMLLTRRDVERLREAVARDRGLSADPLVADDRFWFRAPDGYRQLHTREGGLYPGARACVFLGPDGRCRVHAARPEGCRLYPAFWVEEAAHAELDDVHCPHTDAFRLPIATADAVKRLAARLHSERSS